MGEMADYYCERALERAMNPTYIPNVIDYKCWTMKDGTKIKVCDMSEQHIRNTINMLKRTNDYYGWIPQFKKVLKERE